MVMPAALRQAWIFEKSAPPPAAAPPGPPVALAFGVEAAAAELEELDEPPQAARLRASTGPSARTVTALARDEILDERMVISLSVGRAVNANRADELPMSNQRSSERPTCGP
jgi:hypothetical protein